MSIPEYRYGSQAKWYNTNWWNASCRNQFWIHTMLFIIFMLGSARVLSRYALLRYRAVQDANGAELLEFINISNSVNMSLIQCIWHITVKRLFCQLLRKIVNAGNLVIVRWIAHYLTSALGALWYNACIANKFEPLWRCEELFIILTLAWRSSAHLQCWTEHLAL